MPYYSHIELKTPTISREAKKILRARATTMKARLVPWGYSLSSCAGGSTSSSFSLMPALPVFSLSSSSADGTRVEAESSCNIGLRRSFSGSRDELAMLLVPGRSTPGRVLFGETIASVISLFRPLMPLLFDRDSLDSRWLQRESDGLADTQWWRNGFRKEGKEPIAEIY